VNAQPSVIWRSKPEGLRQRLYRAIEGGLSDCRLPSSSIFFRADDIGVPGKNFERMMTLFARVRTPLALAVVPAWLTPARWRAIRDMGRGAGDLWCWHQHGWRHVSHATSGKKQEFDSRRGPDRIERDLSLGKTRLLQMMGEDFFPGFTPPWNRCGKETLDLLRDMGFLFVSRSMGAVPPPPDGLPDFPVNVDLHTRKEILAEDGWDRLFSEIRGGIAGGRCGVMIHHQRMNDGAFDFLAMCLDVLKAFDGLKRVHLGSLVYR
jgi:hypothetical protein